VSSQQQSQGYKRRSTGERARPTQRPLRATAVAEQGLAASPAEATVVEEVEREPARKTRQPLQSREVVSRSRLDSIINTQRFEGIRKFIRDSWSEIQKVIWPDRETTRNLTLVVIAVSVVLGLLLGGIDYLLFQLFEALP